MKTKLYAINREAFATLPADVQAKAKDTLKAFNEVHIVYEYGEYHVTAGVSIKAVYAPDHKFIGTVYADDIFTEDERILNYVNEFQSFPIQYKGNRDYSIFHTGKRETFVFDSNGNIVIAQ